MKKLINLALIIIAFSISSLALANSQLYADLTDATVKIVDDGNIVHEVSLLLLDNKKSTVTFLDDITKEPISKLHVTSHKENLKKKGLISIEIEYLSFHNNVWVSKSNSSILNEAGAEGIISIFSNENSLDMIVTAYSRDNEIFKTDPRIINISDYESKKQTLVNDLVIQPMARKRCCTSKCGDGSGRILKCCGSVSCGGCGTSCSTDDL
ncbi:hypothetical protein [Pseudoalteromonas arctica]|uniref:Uncharacterized protein n=1 Tax=Pseudoalteromonas arctica TaxID=394751 RepID=A0A7Y0DWA0_9GAMM|nr:hypothetical protein [Pseudoalteromonas arctica]NMM42750.1 hypothetical protein [Pseudoalteromonas arctica]